MLHLKATQSSGLRIQRILFLSSALCILSWAAYAAGGACPSGVPTVGNNCYFIAANGSDSNTGTDEQHPWLHAPGMVNCSGNCASLSAGSGGIGLIFRGGDTWHFGNSAASPYTGGVWDLFNWFIYSYTNLISTCQYEGTQSGCVYVGVDKNWFSGSSWARPILTGDNPTSTSLVSSCAHQIANNPTSSNTNTIVSLASYIIFDNFELTGVCAQNTNGGADAGAYLNFPGTGRTSGYGMLFEENLYLHGWTATTSAGTGGNDQPGVLIVGGSASLQTLDHIVVDGQDSNPGSWAWATFPSFYHVRDSIIRYTNQGVGQWCHDIHDNIFEHFYNHNAGAGSHTNILECNDDSDGTAPGQPQNTPNVFYNNVVRHDDAGYANTGQVHLWFCPETVPEYWFNNLMYDVAAGNDWDYAGPPIYGCSGTGGQFMFNNTLVDVQQPCYVSNVSHGGQYLTVSNEHLINTSFDEGTTACSGLSSATNIAMTDSLATAEGYTTGSSGTSGQPNNCANDSSRPCTPTTSNAATVGNGTNHQDYCAKLATFTSETAISVDAANACKFGTTDGCTYNITTHTMVCPAQTAVARPATGVWDSGAYQYSASAPPPPPANACDVNSDGTVNVSDVQLEVNMALNITSCTNSDNQCTVVQVQRVVNAALGGQCVNP